MYKCLKCKVTKFSITPDEVCKICIHNYGIYDCCSKNTIKVQFVCDTIYKFKYSALNNLYNENSMFLDINGVCSEHPSECIIGGIRCKAVVDRYDLKYIKV